MKLWMSGEIKADVADAYRQARKTVETEVNRLLEGISLPERAREWAFIAIILEEDSAHFNEIVKKSSQGKEFEFRLKIPHGEFLAASRSQKLSLIFHALSRSVQLMEKLGVASKTREQLHEILAEAENNLGVLN